MSRLDELVDRLIEQGRQPDEAIGLALDPDPEPVTDGRPA
jgi:hypothetical protein